MRRLNLRRREPGQSLLEVAIALALLATVIIIVTALANRSTRLNSESGRRSQAVALANKEYEALRLYRDGNSKAGRSWDSTMPPIIAGNCTSFVMETSSDNPDNYTWRGSLTPESGMSTLHQSYQAGEEHHSGLFKRLITLCRSREFDPTDPTNYVSSDSVRTVEVSVIWNEGTGPTREVKFNGVISEW